jgi:type II secretory pathway pseudopilin PulG
MRRGERGFVYVWVLALIAVMAVGLAAVGPLWAQEAKREREDELLRIGSLYAEAIERYYRSSPGSAKRYPRSLDTLLLDSRFVGTVRHLRMLYVDPVAGNASWGLLRASDGGIRGVFSQSTEAPLRVVAMDLGVAVLAPATRYDQWQFAPKEDQ